MDRRRILWALLVISLLAWFGFWFLNHFEYVKTPVERPPKGEASYNPLFAAEHTLTAYGVEADSRAYLGNDPQWLKPGDTLVYYGNVLGLTEEQVTVLHKWMAAGGHLVVHMPPGKLHEKNAFLARYGVQPATSAKTVPCPQLKFPGLDEPLALEACKGRRFVLAGDQGRVTETVGDKGKALVFARMRVGQGALSVLSSMAFMANSSLNEPGAGRYLLQVLAPNLGHGRVYMVYSAGKPPWPLLLWHGAWPFLVGLLVFVVAWLAAVMPRFGPLRSPRAPPRRALLEHVHASAETLARSGAADVLHGAVLDDVNGRMRRRHPEVAAMSDSEKARWLAEFEELPLIRVWHALHDKPARADQRFRESILTLLKLRKQL